MLGYTLNHLLLGRRERDRQDVKRNLRLGLYNSPHF